jgi:uncharacterized protein
VEHARQRGHDADPSAVARERYEQMNAGDIASAAAKMHPQLEWIEAEHSPYARPGSPLVGVTAVIHAVWSHLALDWVNLRFVPEEFIPLADGVAVVSRYLRRHARSGATLDAQALHLWTVTEGTIRRFRGFADTYTLHQTIGA